MAFWWGEARTLNKHPRWSQHIGFCLQALPSGCKHSNAFIGSSGFHQAHPPATLHLRVALPSAWDVYRKENRLVLISHTSPPYPDTQSRSSGTLGVLLHFTLMLLHYKTLLSTPRLQTLLTQTPATAVEHYLWEKLERAVWLWAETSWSD